MVDWTQILIALAVGLPATITAAGAVLLGWHNSKKIDTNTEITKRGTHEAAANAIDAAEAASSAKEAADRLSRTLNGDLDIRIKNAIDAAVAPIHVAIETHAGHDEKNMEEIRGILSELIKGKP